jgi:cellulose synthase/poly-beta-1,6-N-acetylglucosamine synthase-like glycosyltransferase
MTEFLSGTLFIYLLLATLHLLVFSIAGCFYHQETRPATASRYRKFAVLIPAYKEDAVILSTARNASVQTYPTEKFDIVVIADALQNTTIEQLKKLPVTVLEVSFENSTKAKSLNAAERSLDDSYDAIVIIDADNLMEKQFLEKANAAMDSGLRVLQTHRTAKNISTPVALLDAASEEINNHIFRKGRRTLGLSAALIGSGIVMEASLFREMVPQLKTVGEDKELERLLLLDRITTGYLDDTMVLDEKVSQSRVFQKQRTRWIGTQWQMLKETLPLLPDALLKGNLGYVDKVLQMAFPPRLLLLGTTTIITALSFAGLPGTAGWMWTILLILQGAALMIALPARFRTRNFFMAALRVPGLFVRMLAALIASPRSGKTFIHTPHDDHSKTRKEHV